MAHLGVSRKCGRERKREMWAGRNWGETERLQAMENGFSVIPHEVDSARRFAVRKPGKVREVETVGNCRNTHWLNNCGSS